MKKSKRISKLILCSCHSPEHQMLFTFWEDDWEPQLDVTVHLRKSKLLGKWGRLIGGIKYIFGYQCKYGDWDEILLQKEQVAELRDALNLFLEKHDQWQLNVDKKENRNV